MAPTIKELREWSAGLMGWKLKVTIDQYGNISGEWFSGDEYSGFDSYFLDVDEGLWENLSNLWQPDTNLNQAFMVVGRMRELGWAFHFNGRVENTDYGVGFAREYSVDRNLGLYKTSLGHAILLAAHATGEGHGIPDPEEK